MTMLTLLNPILVRVGQGGEDHCKSFCSGSKSRSVPSTKRSTLIRSASRYALCRHCCRSIFLLQDPSPSDPLQIRIYFVKLVCPPIFSIFTTPSSVDRFYQISFSLLIGQTAGMITVYFVHTFRLCHSQRRGTCLLVTYALPLASRHMLWLILPQAKSAIFHITNQRPRMPHMLPIIISFYKTHHPSFFLKLKHRGPRIVRGCQCAAHACSLTCC